MIKKQIATGTIHKIPTDLRDVLISNPKVLLTWNDITPLARNEWICWVDSAKREETRERRIRIASENLAKGKRRPCCWVGCGHR